MSANSQRLGIAGHLTRSFITSPLTPLIMLAALAMGLIALVVVPREEEPQISVPMVNILIQAPGLRAADAVKLVTEPMETIVRAIDDVEHVYSQTMDDRAMVTARFVVGTPADAAILRPPSFLMGNPFDVAFVRRAGWEDISYLIYLNATEATGRMLAEWVRLCDQHPNVWDQVLFSLAWFRTARETALASQWFNGGVSRTPRPKIRDLRDRLFYYPFGRKIRPFIDQKQASRRLKAYVNASARPKDEIGSDDLSAGYRAALANLDFSFDPQLDAIVSRRT